METQGPEKTHLSIGLAREWCLVREDEFVFTLQRVLSATAASEAVRAVHQKLDRFELLIIDDISYVPLSANETDVLFNS